MFEHGNKDPPVQIRQNTVCRGADYRRKPCICFEYRQHDRGSPSRRALGRGRLGAPQHPGKPGTPLRQRSLQLAAGQPRAAPACVPREGKQGKACFKYNSAASSRNFGREAERCDAPVESASPSPRCDSAPRRTLLAPEY